MQKLKTILVLSLAALLPACGTMMEGSTQEVLIATPGAQEAECTLNNGVRYIGRTGQTLNIMKSRNPLTVECYGTGNRYKKVVIESDDSDWAAGNIATAGTGFIWDHYAGGMYKYPDVLTIDFVGIPTTGFELPDYHYNDAPNPYKQSIEAYGPSVPRTAEDSAYMKRGIQKRDAGAESNPFASYAAEMAPAKITDAPAMTPTPEGGAVKAAPMAAKTTTTTTTTTTAPAAKAPAVWGKDAESLNRAMNPTVFDAK